MTAAPNARTYVTEIWCPSAGDEVLHRLHLPMREPEPLPEPRNGDRVMTATPLPPGPLPPGAQAYWPGHGYIVATPAPEPEAEPEPEAADPEPEPEAGL